MAGASYTIGCSDDLQQYTVDWDACFVSDVLGAFRDAAAGATLADLYDAFDGSRIVRAAQAEPSVVLSDLAVISAHTQPSADVLRMHFTTCNEDEILRFELHPGRAEATLGWYRHSDDAPGKYGGGDAASDDDFATTEAETDYESAAADDADPDHWETTEYVPEGLPSLPPSPVPRGLEELAAPAAAPADAPADALADAPADAIDDAPADANADANADAPAGANGALAGANGALADAPADAPAGETARAR